MSTPIQPAKGLPFRLQSREFRIDQYITVLTGCVLVDRERGYSPADWSNERRLNWYMKQDGQLATETPEVLIEVLAGAMERLEIEA